jgi:very-short-patch-repair endonuclease
MREPGAIRTGKRHKVHPVRVLAADREGVVGRAQLLEHGVGASSIARAARSGLLHRLHRGVYSVVAPELLSEDGHVFAALMAAGPGAMLARGTAAWRWRITPAPPTHIELSVPRYRRGRLAGVELIRHGPLRPGDVTWNGRFRSTSVARTLLDLAVRYDQAALLKTLAEAEFQHDLRPDDVLRILRRGHPGSARLRAALNAHVPGHGQARSQLERRFRALLIRHRIELPVRNEQIGPWTVDCLWPERRVVVELDGRQHARPHQADSDDDRDLWLRRHGYVTRRYGTKQIDEQPDAALADLRAAFKEATTTEAHPTPLPSKPKRAPASPGSQSLSAAPQAAHPPPPPTAAPPAAAPPPHPSRRARRRAPRPWQPK